MNKKRKYYIEVRKRIAPGLTQLPYIAEAYIGHKYGTFAALDFGYTAEEAKRRLMNQLESVTELIEESVITLSAEPASFKLSHDNDKS